jgi:RNA 3'-terminal phosphate cyclase (ATP)
MIDIDGSMGEGGGQILRSSLALSLLTQKPFRLRRIRAKRAKPGLQPQHLQSVRAAAQIGSAQVSGDALGSTELTFRPGPVLTGSYRFAIGTAGATGLVLHTVYLPLALANSGPSTVVITGGTHVSASPCFHFLESTWRSFLRRIGLQVELQMRRTGFYPRGGGEIQAEISACRALRGLAMTAKPAVSEAICVSACAGLAESIAERQLRRARF